MKAMFNPFDHSSIQIRGDQPGQEHVRVWRMAPKADGKRCHYRKEFLDLGENRNFNYWNSRETELLQYLNQNEARHVVKLININIDEDDDNWSIDAVTTRDAGLSLDNWLQLKPRLPDGSRIEHAFYLMTNGLKLAKGILEALKEIHKIGVVHCDIKLDNICIDYQPYE